MSNGSHLERDHSTPFRSIFVNLISLSKINSQLVLFYFDFEGKCRVKILNCFLII